MGIFSQRRSQKHSRSSFGKRDKVVRARRQSTCESGGISLAASDSVSSCPVKISRRRRALRIPLVATRRVMTSSQLRTAPGSRRLRIFSSATSNASWLRSSASDRLFVARRAVRSAMSEHSFQSAALACASSTMCSSATVLTSGLGSVLGELCVDCCRIRAL